MNERVYKYNPSKVFLLIGTNDLEQEVSKVEIENNIEKIVKGIKENRPYAKIYVESIYPVEEENAGKRKNKDIKEINKNIEKMCKKEHVDYIDMYSKLKDDDDKLKEKYSKDGLHISNKGYEEITKEIKKYLK
jgi:lysophospholipase L1-like esterase